MEAQAHIIEVHDLHRSFGAREAVAGISFCVRRGEIFGLLGPNGVGKTTTIRILTGQIDPSKGRASVVGFDVVKERAQLKTRIGVVFEEQNLYERLSARLNLEFSCWLYGLRQTITHLSHEGMTILLTTQLMEEADHLISASAWPFS